MPFDMVVLADRLPYPPVGGDRLRVYHVCRILAQQGARIHLLAFARSEEEAGIAKNFPGREWFAGLRLVPLNKTLAAARVFWTFFNRESMQLQYHHSEAMRRELAELMRQFPVRAILCHLIRMAPYAKPYPNVRRVLEMVDVFSEYYARSKRLVKRRGLLVYSLEEPRIRKAEKEALDTFDAVVVVAPREKELLVERYPASAPKVHVLPNGAPDPRPDSKVDPDRIVFHGYLAYPPNRDAALFFAKEIFPKVRERIPSIRFQIFGGEPGPELRGLNVPGVELVGPVEDMAEHVRGALASVCPLRAAAGLQNKVLESMAWGVPVVSTSATNSGIGAEPGTAILIAESAGDWIRHLEALRSDPALRRRLSEAGRTLIRERFTWNKTLAPYLELLKVGQQA